MPIKLYMDHNVPRAITDGLRTRGVDILTSLEDGTQELSDPEILDRANALGRVLFTRDFNLLQEVTRRQRRGAAFYWHHLCPSTKSLYRKMYS